MMLHNIMMPTQTKGRLYNNFEIIQFEHETEFFLHIKMFNIAGGYILFT